MLKTPPLKHATPQAQDEDPLHLEQTGLNSVEKPQHVHLGINPM